MEFDFNSYKTGKNGLSIGPSAESLLNLDLPGEIGRAHV